MTLRLLPCLNCGHRADEHRPVDLGVYVTHDGARIQDIRLAGCGFCDPDLFIECGCEVYEPDSLARVTELLGLDVRRVVV